jgi:hypothetical protein
VCGCCTTLRSAAEGKTCARMHGSSRSACEGSCRDAWLPMSDLGWLCGGRRWSGLTRGQELAAVLHAHSSIASTKIRHRVPGHARGARVLQDMGRPVGRRGREEERMRWRRRAHVLPVKVGRGWHYLRSHGKSGFERVESRESSGAKRRRRTVQRGVEEERQLDSDSQRAVRVADNGSCIARVGNRYRVPISNSPWRFPVEERGELKACSGRCSSKSSAARG